MSAKTFGTTKCKVPVTVSSPDSRYGDALDQRDRNVMCGPP